MTSLAFMSIKHGSVAVPIYKGRVRRWDCYTVAFYLNGKRVRRNFGSLEKAKAEAQLMARKIMEGKSFTNDLTCAQRENHLAAERLVAPFNMPLVAAVEEYARCRQLLGDVPLMAAIQEFVRRNRGVQLGVKVPDLIAEFLRAKAEDNLSRVYRFQLSGSVKRFAAAFPGELLIIKSGDIDRWLRSLNHTPVTRNSLHRCIKVFFSFAKSRGYLPQSEATAAELVPIAKEGETKTEIFQPAEMTKLLAAASSEELALLAIGGFAGLRMAEIKRLDWKAVDLDRRIITLRADQAKTASRRIVPISDNLAAWIEPLPREGKVVGKVAPDLTKVAAKIGMEWPRNALRHSYISYRLAVVKDAAKVALEAGNSPDIIFKHYRELVTEPEAKEWFSIMPPKGWSPPEPKKPKAKPRRPRKLVDAIFG
jgi:integrase